MENEELLDGFIQCLLRISGEGSMREFLQGLLTEKELSELPARLAILQMLAAGYTQRQVAQELGVGIATVSRGASVLRAGKLDAYIRGTENP